MNKSRAWQAPEWNPYSPIQSATSKNLTKYYVADHYALMSNFQQL